MRLVLLEITNFRGIRTGRVALGRHSVLVGPNNCGKTTIIEALALLFGRDRLVRSLTEHDFYGGRPKPQDRIKIVATVGGFKDDDFTVYPSWFGDNRGVPKWLDPTNSTVHAVRTDNASSLVCQIAFAARFDKDTLEVETARYFHDDPNAPDVFEQGTWVSVPLALIREVGLFLVPANRAWDKVISFGSELFRRVVASGGGLPAAAVIEERDALRKPAKPLEEDPNLTELITDLNTELSGFFSSKPKLQLRVTSTDSEGVLDAVVPHYVHEGADWSVPARRHGSGLVSLQWLLLLLQFGRRRALAGQGFWIALEEPELHVPPALQRRIVHRLQALSTQTIVSTHSPMVAALSDSRGLSVLRNEGGTLTCQNLASAVLEQATPNAVRKLFELNRLDTIAALMHDVVLVPEGRIDVDLIRLLVRIVDAHQSWDASHECRFDAHLGLVPTHDGSVVVTYDHLSKLHAIVVCLVDGDAAGTGYVTELEARATPPQLILRWPENWMVEDMIGWVAGADEVAFLAALANSSLPQPSASVPDLVQRLKTKGQGGLKSDNVSYEAIAETVIAVPDCVARARELLNAMSDTCMGIASPRFAEPAGHPRVRTFQP
ncbi:ATP-dependent nuclease [Ramlibacter sp.]|uniref:ATP-dependent nuclease n=1 Tax=Ramlibacter sp. TaxID=1917967 RepID=UPI002CA5F18F|nr:AAA family ATPase [Ramlibacter sp.]HWI83849.1 AAA family ATPase [Ramlibacter sp.]